MTARTATESPTAPATGSKPFHRQRTDAQKREARDRHQQEGYQGLPARLLLPGSQPLGQLLENQEAGNYHGRADCQGSRRSAIRRRNADDRRGCRNREERGAGRVGSPGRCRSARGSSGQPDEVDESGDEAQRRADPGRHGAEAQSPAEPLAEEVAGAGPDQEQEPGGRSPRRSGRSGTGPEGAKRASGLAPIRDRGRRPSAAVRNGCGATPIASVPVAQIATTAVSA